MTGADVANFVNSVSLPSKGLEEAKRKRSESTDLATSDLAKRARTQSAHSAVATDTMNARSQVDMGKLNRPPPQLCTKPSMPVNQKDIFDLVSEPEKELPKQASKEPKKRGRRRKNKELSTMLAALPQTSALNEPDIPATSAAPPLHARRGRSPESPDLHSQGEQHQHSGGNPRNRVKKSTPSRQPKGRQTRSQKPVAALSSRISPHPLDETEVIRSPSADRDGIVRESHFPNRGDGIGNEQVAISPQFAESLEKTKHSTPGISEPGLPQQDLGKNAFASKVRTGSQTSAQQLENIQEEGDPIDNANGDEGKEHDGYGENRDLESDEQGDDSQEPGEQESDGSESEDQDFQDSEGVASDGAELELLGQNDVWRDINEARREVDVSIIKDHKIRSPQTKQGTRMVELFRKAAQTYDSPNQNESQVQPQQVLESLSQCIEDLSEDSCPGEECGMIQDVYVHAIPGLIVLLGKVFKAQSAYLSGRKDISTLKEMIGFQEALIKLCQKARDWKAKPNTSSPIIKPTITIFPLIKTMRNAFIEELEDRKRLRRIRANRANQPPKIDEASIQREREKRKREDLAILQHIEDDCNQGHATWWREDLARVHEPDAQPAKAQPTTTRYATARSAGTNQEAVENWSEEQKKALLKELVRKKHWNLTAEEMFLKALNAPSLQNKLPEHIREKALEFKAAIEQSLENNAMPKWVSCIQ
ncbi:MAG: hypothetical protein L6R38_004085 [Xanthoria sp. 2 TBL-2021]|nr:MAG: hypothetical protein L6R38_004085 [Xanthoria sp. 2 TBL-2021]